MYAYVSREAWSTFIVSDEKYLVESMYDLILIIVLI